MDNIKIRRAEHGIKNPYFMFVRATAQNHQLSLEAVGLLAYCLSLPSNFVINPQYLMEYWGIGQQKVYRILAELKKAGYAKRDRHQDKRGKFIWGDYEIAELPIFINNKPSDEKPYMDDPYMGKPDILNNRYEDIEDTDSSSPEEGQPPSGDDKKTDLSSSPISQIEVTGQPNNSLESVPTEMKHDSSQMPLFGEPEESNPPAPKVPKENKRTQFLTSGILILAKYRNLNVWGKLTEDDLNQFKYDPFLRVLFRGSNKQKAKSTEDFLWERDLPISWFEAFCDWWVNTKKLNLHSDWRTLYRDFQKWYLEDGAEIHDQFLAKQATGIADIDEPIEVTYATDFKTEEREDL